MAKPEREFSAVVGQKSMGTAGPDYIKKDLDKALAMFDPNKTLPDGSPGGIGEENMKQGAVSDEVIGNREIDDTQVLGSNVGFISAILNGMAHMIKAITGKIDWKTKPDYTLEKLGQSTIDGVKNIGGDIDFVAGAGVEITPDVAGKKITFAAKNDSIIPGKHAETHGSSGTDPVTPASIGAADARHTSETSVHGATSAATPSRMMMRAASGTAKVAAPVEDDDIARKAEVYGLVQISGRIGGGVGVTGITTDASSAIIQRIMINKPVDKSLYLKKVRIYLYDPNARIRVEANGKEYETTFYRGEADVSLVLTEGAEVLTEVGIWIVNKAGAGKQITIKNFDSWHISLNII